MIYVKGFKNVACVEYDEIYYERRPTSTIIRIGSAIMLISILLISIFSSIGCQATGTATTQPANVVGSVTAAEAALDIAVNAIHAGISLKLIDNATYWAKIDPVIQTANAAISSANAAAVANAAGDSTTALADLNAASVAENSAMAAVQQLGPYVAQSQTKAK